MNLTDAFSNEPGFLRSDAGKKFTNDRHFLKPTGQSSSPSTTLKMAPKPANQAFVSCCVVLTRCQVFFVCFEIEPCFLFSSHPTLGSLVDNFQLFWLSEKQGKRKTPNWNKGGSSVGGSSSSSNSGPSAKKKFSFKKKPSTKFSF